MMCLLTLAWLIVPIVGLRASGPDDDPPAKPGIAVAPDSDATLRDVLRQVFADLNTPDAPPRIWPFLRLGPAQAKLGDLEGARASFGRAAEIAGDSAAYIARQGNTTTYGDSPADDLWRLALAQSEAGLRDDARATLAKAGAAVDRTANLGIETLALIAREQAKLGDRDGAKATLGRAVEVYDHLKNHKPDDARRSEASLAAVRAAAGDYEGVQAMLEWVKIEGLGNLHGRIARIHGEVAPMVVGIPDPATARATLEAIAGDLDAIGGHGLKEIKATALARVCEAWVGLGDFAAAKDVARETGERSTFLLTLIAGEQCRRGDPDGARATLDEAYRAIVEAPATTEPDSRLYQLAWAQITAGDLAGARRSVAAIGSGRMSDALAMLALAERRAGDEAAAQATLRRALEDLEYRNAHRAELEPGEIPFPSQQPAGDPEARWRAGVLRKIAAVEAQRGDRDAALATARSIEDAPTRRWALSGVVGALAEQGQAAEALKQARSFDPPDVRLGLTNVADGVLRFLQARESVGGEKEK